MSDPRHEALAETVKGLPSNFEPLSEPCREDDEVQEVHATNLPKTGIIIPDMGRPSRKSRKGLADALFTPVQQRVLGLLFGQPDRRFQSAELIRLAGGGVGAVHRQLARLTESGLVTVTRSGNQKHYQARRDSPVFEELHGLAVKTVGVAEPLRRALGTFGATIHAAFVYGSVAKGSDRVGSDIDVIVVSDSLGHAAVFEAVQGAESALGRKINPRLLSRAQWRTRRSRSDSFVSRIAREPRIFLVGSEDDLE
jgi:predicted nucleotidyltransferase